MWADTIAVGAVCLFVGVMLGIGVMALIQPYCCRLQPEDDK